MKIALTPRKKLGGSPVLMGDKSLSHRALLFGGLAEGLTEVRGLSSGEDVRSSARCLKALGVKIEEGETTRVHGLGIRGFQAPTGDLDCGNSGTTMRLFMGFLSAQNFSSRLIGDASLSRRPMNRVSEPLETMGARFEMTDGKFAPLVVRGSGKLSPASYDLKVASAQVKSAILLAGLYADGTTRVTGEIQSRDHTERLLPYFGAKLDVSPEAISITGGQKLVGRPFDVPGDPSSAAFWCAAACVVENGWVEIKNVLLNPTRIGFLRVLERMGAKVRYETTSEWPEPVGNVRVDYARLSGTAVRPEEVPSLIDELPLVAVLGAYAHGVTEVRGAEELRVKETDRIEAVAENLRRMGAEIETFEDGFRIEGPQKLRGATIDSFHDHRIAMAFSIAALSADGVTMVERAESVKISYPSFYETLERICD